MATPMSPMLNQNIAYLSRLEPGRSVVNMAHKIDCGIPHEFVYTNPITNRRVTKYGFTRRIDPNTISVTLIYPDAVMTVPDERLIKGDFSEKKVHPGEAEYAAADEILREVGR